MLSVMLTPAIAVVLLAIALYSARETIGAVYEAVGTIGAGT